jgi:FkbM family methyltransferase
VDIRHIQFPNSLPNGLVVALYGGGRHGRALARLLADTRPDIQILTIIDDRIEEPEHTPPIGPMSGALRKRLRQDDVAVVVPQRLFGAVRSRLEAARVARLVVTDQALDLAHLFQPRDILARQSDIRRCTQLLPAADAAMFRKIVAARTFTSDYYEPTHPRHSLPPYPADGCEYLDYLDRTRLRTIVDGGVANGETELSMLTTLPQTERMYGFDSAASLYVQGTYREPLSLDGRFEFVPQGLWSTSANLALHPNGHGTYVTDEQPVSQHDCASVTTLDAFVEARRLDRIDLIKLDVEGCERAALEGACRTTARLRPALAVCIYHERDDLFELPLFLAEHLDGYRFRLGHYSRGFLDTVLYAIPEEHQLAQAA